MAERMEHSAAVVRRNGGTVECAGAPHRTAISWGAIAGVNIPCVTGHDFLKTGHHHFEYAVITPTDHAVLRGHRK